MWYGVRVLDDFSGGRFENLEGMSGDLEVVEGSILDEGLLGQCMEGVDGVFHLAAKIYVRESLEQPEEYMAVNCNGTLNVIRKAVELGVGRVVYSSSAAVYGEQDKLPISENSKLSPCDPYAISKYYGEICGEEYCREGNISFMALRYFNVYGARQNKDSEYAGVIAKFVDRYKRGEELVVYGDGQQTRDFVFVKDVVSANIRCMEDSREGYSCYNCASGIDRTVESLAKMFDCGVTYDGGRSMVGIEKSVGDISKIVSEVGWEPKWKLEEALKTMSGNLGRNMDVRLVG